ncbi:IS5 family transposase, partial [Magnetococcales bacterium HHB-1]
MELPLQVPHFSRFSRRQANLEIELPRNKKNKSVHLVMDSSGLKIHGDSEWHQRKHGTSRRRKWRKMHITVDENSKEITASLLTDSSAGDGAQLPDLLEQTPDNVNQVSATGAYDSQACHEAVALHGATAMIPPRKNTKLEWEDWDKDTEDQRKELRKEIVRYGYPVGAGYSTIIKVFFSALKQTCLRWIFQIIYLISAFVFRLKMDVLTFLSNCVGQTVSYVQNVEASFGIILRQENELLSVRT